MAKTESCHRIFNEPLLFAKPLKLNMPRGLVRVEFEIYFPNGLFEEVSRDTRMGHKRLIEAAREVEIEVLELREYRDWKSTSLRFIKENKAEPFSEIITVTPLSAAYFPILFLKIVRNTPETSNAKVNNQTILRAINVEYLPRKIIKTVTAPQIPGQP